MFAIMHANKKRVKLDVDIITQENIVSAAEFVMNGIVCRVR